ncbi:MAG: putative quinol monooxygenase [Deinococcus sp.]
MTPSRDSQAVTLQAVITPHPERWEATQSALRELVQGSRQEPGCLIYDLLHGEEGGQRRLYVQERYRDIDAVQAHRDSGHYEAFQAKAGGWFAEPTRVLVLHDLDVASQG